MAPQPEPRLPLSRDRILRAALELVDENGIDSLTMRRLGQQLGFEAMSLYNHVANKDEVIDGMLDRVLDEAEHPAPGRDWETSIRESAVSIHAALRNHPWAANVLMSYGQVRPARLQYMESLLGRLREAGFSAETTYHAYHVLDGHIFGFSLWETAHSFSEEEESEMEELFQKVITAEAFPYLREHGEQHMNEGPHHDVSAFEFGLDLILDGLKKIHASS
ncbi:MAG TPA: TetR/AcrR family transcriptional regulator C-terminal domain-containing protein [Gaiellaceae bacterium]|nr:TetR/AcrR family transcriptional regulator C-terminal domain-containing protein [Gaiellaceae bacterium]